MFAKPGQYGIKTAPRWAVLLCLCLAASAQAPVVEELVILPGVGATPFPHFWEQTFGSGRAVLSLRESYRKDLHAMREATSIRNVRFHAIFQDEVGLYSEDAAGKPVYNFSYIDQIYDGLLENGVRPYIELSFMPRALAASQTPHAFWYKQLPNPPKDYAQWGQLVKAFTQHLVERYGIEEVSQWLFEVWNEPNIDFWTGEPKQETYFHLYDEAARAVKAVDGRLQVGGPATAQAAWISAMIDHAVKQNVPLDFVSTHVYGNDSAKDVFGTNEEIPRRDMVARSAKKVHDEVKKSARPNLPIHWSEYNASYMNEMEVTDSEFMGPWLANNIRMCDGLTTTMSYWTFSDVFEEQGVVKTPFYGGYGLIAEGGIPKAAFNAFRMLHRLGDRRLPSQKNDSALVTRRPDGVLAAALWNYAGPGETGPARQVRIRVEGRPRIHVQWELVDREHGSSLRAWEAMGRPAYPTRDQYQKLKQAASATLRGTGEVISIPAHGLALVEVTPQ